MKWLHPLAFLLIVVGAINWGLVGLLDLNLVHLILGGMPAIENIVYILVGAAGIYSIFDHKQNCMMCAGKGKK